MDMPQQIREAPSPQTPQSRTVPRSARSKDGCATCKRRKVKCDEQRPRCSHCERLNLECKWQPPSARRRSTVASTPPVRAPGARVSVAMTPGTTVISPTATLMHPPPHAVNQVFDYASFLWDGSDAWRPTPDVGATVSFEPQVVGPGFDGQFLPPAPDTSPGMSMNETGSMHEQSEASAPDAEQHNGDDFNGSMPLAADNHRLMDYFIHAVTPPILAEVETQKKWVVMRQTLIKMANSSRMVRWAVLAFSNLMLCRRDGAWLSSQQNHYSNATIEVATFDDASFAQRTAQRKNLLATLFFLCYVDILEGRTEAAHSNLKRAYNIFQQGQGKSFTSLEKQLLLWIRLLDARAVSAGGEGLFLSKDDEDLLVEPSPATFGGESPPAGNEETDDLGVEDVLFQVLYQPGIMFFQKVQSFMGRISKIDPWHRPRGTVEDETEVMNLGAAIATDLRSLYEQRPLLMDYAVAGKLTAPYVSAHLAFVVTRAFRTYLSNYYASKIHLHRVAYKTFPLTTEASDAMSQIRRLTKLIAEGLDIEDSLPVNMLWPLLMLGSEEQDLEERAWIKSQILRMEKVAGNARITAQVLEEVQARQDASKIRVDIRSVMHDIFNSCFAIV